MSSLTVLVALTLSIAAAQAPTPGFTNGVCTVTESVSDRPPDDPHSTSFAIPHASWFANARRTVWAWWWGKTSDGGYKVLWVRPAGAQMTITGKRLDAESPAMTASIPAGYPFSYQASGLYFPAPGCWQVDGSASGESVRFVVLIK